MGLYFTPQLKAQFPDVDFEALGFEEIPEGYKEIPKVEPLPSKTELTSESISATNILYGIGIILALMVLLTIVLRWIKELFIFLRKKLNAYQRKIISNILAMGRKESFVKISHFLKENWFKVIIIILLIIYLILYANAR